MHISVFGLGYVGSVTAACLAADGHSVIGVDVVPAKVDAIAAGRSPVMEAGLAEIVGDAVARGRLTAIADAARAVRDSELSLVCVGTPSQRNGSLDLSAAKRVTAHIGEALARKHAYHRVVYRSTMLPGSVEETLLPVLAGSSARHPGRDFGVAVNPEFLREGSAVSDFRAPARTVIGELDARSGDGVAALYAGLEAPVIRTPIRLAEMVKYADNAFHALKIAFANEMGGICKREGIDSHLLMEILCRDTKLNISPAYLRPGFAFGGSCLPKDLRSLVYRARTADVAAPLLESVLISNESRIRAVLDMIFDTERRRIGILGLTFKAGTDDLRESPAVILAETLIGKGYEVVVYDRVLSLSRLIGSNRAYIEQEIPHIGTLMCPSLEEMLERAEVLVVTNSDPEFVTVPPRVRPDQILIDLVRLPHADRCRGVYRGIAW